jgi:uncharacterized transporter YbjL
MKAPGQVTFKRVIVTNKPVLGKTVRQLGFEEKRRFWHKGSFGERGNKVR